MNAAVVADGVRKRYGDLVALDGVSLSVDPGEVFGLIGPNGAGKTTLVRCLTGTTDCDGTVRVLGDSPTEVDRERIGLLPQAFGPPERLTVRELVGYYAGLYDDARDPTDVIGEVGLEAAADTWYERLSGGQQRRTCVAVALVNDPDVLFLDEPTTGIDPAGRRSLWRVIEDLAERGRTVFLTSHSMPEVERLADRVALVRDGEVVASGSPETLVAEHGGEPQLVVRTTAGTEAVVDAGYRAEASAEELVLHGVPAEEIGEAVATLDAAGVDFDSVAWREPTLEDVYLTLTGERFEGESTGPSTLVSGGTSAIDGGASGGGAE